MRSLRQIFSNVFKLAFTLVILLYLYKKGALDFSRVSAALTSAHTVALCLIIIGMAAVAGSLRWWLLLQGQDLRISKMEAFELTMIGGFFNLAIPGSVSGDLVKGYYVARQQVDGGARVKAFTTLLLDRVLGLSSLITVSFVSMLLNFQDVMSNPILRSLAGLVAVLWVGVALFYAFVLIEWPFTARVIAMLRRLPAGSVFVNVFEALKAYESCPRYIFKGLAISIGIHCGIMVMLALLAHALGGFESVPLNKFFFLAPFGILVTAIPIAPAGLGTGHAAFLALFNLVGAHGGADLFTASVSFQLFVSLVGGVFYVKYRDQMNASLLSEKRLA